MKTHDDAALARAISLVENEREGFEDVLIQAHARLGNGQVSLGRRIGITGPPGAGKSALVVRLVQRYRAAGLRVAVVAVDPTSPYTGGALLGDRVRMEAVSLDPGVFIRSMATRGSHGGLATTTAEVADVLESFGFERVIVETVGVGQTELDIARAADSTALVLVPESGDGIQALKAGVMEIADVFVVNKSDRPGADKLKQEIEVMLGIRRGNAFRRVNAPQSWEPPVVSTVAPKGEGIDDLVGALDAHHAWLESTGALAVRRRERLVARTRAVVERALRRWAWDEMGAQDLVAGRLDDVAAGRRSPYEVAAEVMSHVKTGASR